MWPIKIGFLQTLISFVTICCFSAALDIHVRNDHEDLKLTLDKMVVELGAGRLAVSSYLHYTADNCLQHFNTSQTVGQESLNCYANAYGKRNANNNSKDNPGQKKMTEEQNWHNLCSVWPLLSQCHKKTTVPATDQCYKATREKQTKDKHESNFRISDFRRGTHALSFTDAYLNFHCTDIQRTVGVLEIARPSHFICFKDLQENIKNCTKTAVDRNVYTEYNLTRGLELIRDCFKEEYNKKADYCLRKNSEAGKVLPYIEEMFISINSHLAIINKNNNFQFQETSELPQKDESINIVPIVSNKVEMNKDESSKAKDTTQNSTGVIKDPYLQDFLTKVMHPEEESIFITTNDDITTKAAISSDLYQNDAFPHSPPANINKSSKVSRQNSFGCLLLCTVMISFIF